MGGSAAAFVLLLCLVVVGCVAEAQVLTERDVRALVGKPADVAGGAYTYRCDRDAARNPPEAWILLMQYAGLPFDRPVDHTLPAVRRVVCGLMWEEVRPVRRLELSWAAAERVPEGDLVVSYFDATDDSAHTWWNPRTIREAGPPVVSRNGLTRTYSIPVDTWGIVVSRRGAPAAGVTAPVVRALVDDVWRRMDIELEWGFDAQTARRRVDGRLELYDALVGPIAPLPGDRGTSVTGVTWRSTPQGGARRGLRFALLVTGTSRWRRMWPYSAQPEDVSRSLVTVRHGKRAFTIQASDLDMGPILAPESGFFIRSLSRAAGRAPRSPAVFAAAPTPLSERADSFPGVPKMRGWASNGIPWFGANPEHTGGSAGSLVIPPRCVAMHPAVERAVAVGWQAPAAMTVRCQGSLAMADTAGGNGVAWTLVAEAPRGPRVLAAGAVDTGGRAQVAASRAVSLRAGDRLWLVVDARDGSHVCDTTVVDVTVAEVGGAARAWNLTRDVVDGVHAADSMPGASGAWRFASAVLRAADDTARSEPPFATSSEARTAREFIAERRAMRLSTIRSRTRAHAEPTWQSSVAAMHGPGAMPPMPVPPFTPPMQIDVPDARWVAQWNLAAWHLLRHSVVEPDGRRRFNDYPFGILSSETYMILRALDLMGLHREAEDGFAQWLTLPLRHSVVAGQGGHHVWALPDRPLGHFSDGDGALTHATGPDGAGGHMDGVHAMGPGAIGFALSEHFRLTGDLDWLRANAARMVANAEWILRQRKLLRSIIPGGDRLWSKGLQPAHVVTPDSMSMHMQFYESEAYYYLAVQRTAEMVAVVDPPAGARLAREAADYRRDLVQAIDRSIALTPLVPVRDGTYRSFVPFAPYVRGFAAGAWGWRRCQGHVGAIYWDTVQSADPLVSPSGLLAATDARVQGHLDVLEDRLLLENTKVNARTADYDAERDWFASASWQYQCGLERHANIHLEADDPPNFLRSLFNQYAVDIKPGEYTFQEHTTGGPPDKVYEESCFVERFRQMLVCEVGETLWLARATPRTWLQDGKRIAVRSAPSGFGPVGFEVTSSAERGSISATVTLPTRNQPQAVVLRLRHPTGARMKRVTVGGANWTRFDAKRETVTLFGLAGSVRVRAEY